MILDLRLWFSVFLFLLIGLLFCFCTWGFWFFGNGEEQVENDDGKHGEDAFEDKNDENEDGGRKIKVWKLWLEWVKKEQIAP